MSTRRELPRRRRSWPSPRLLCVGAVMLLSSCSRQSSPATPSLLNSSTGVEHVHSSKASEASPAVASMLAAVRAATAKYHDVSQALGHGYQLGYKGVVTACIANPGVGAMGYHYFNWTKMDDPSIVQDDPEVLVYHTGDDGTLVLGAVEWVVPKALWDGAGNTNPPSVFGESLHILNPVLNWYVEYAWVWKHNPDGMFADWNPDVTCP